MNFLNKLFPQKDGEVVSYIRTLKDAGSFMEALAYTTEDVEALSRGTRDGGCAYPTIPIPDRLLP